MNFINKVKKFLIKNKIAVISGVALFIFVVMSATDYTDQIKEYKTKLTKIETEISETKVAHESEVKSTRDEVAKLKNETKEIQDKHSAIKEEARIAKKAEQDKKAEAERKAKQEAERKMYEPKLIVDGDNMDVWNVYLDPSNTLFTISYNGSRNCIVKAGGRLVINEIGSGNYVGRVNVPNAGWYELEVTHCGGGYNWNFN